MLQKDETHSSTESLDAQALEQALLDAGTESVHVYDGSLREHEERLYALVRRNGERWLVVAAAEEPDFEYEATVGGEENALYLCPCSSKNARQLRKVFPWTAPVPLGRVSAIGCGDRLGLATPGHIRACRSTDVVPVLAQQSIREMQRTGRSPQEVLDDVSWAVFREGYESGFGADADHLKTEAHVDVCLLAGYTMYTIDPSDYVTDEADRLSGDALRDRFRALPWDQLGTSPEASLDRYTDAPISVEGDRGETTIEISPTELRRAAVKYGEAIAHTRHLAEYLATQYREHRPGEPYDLEMSVDETASPTRAHEHYFVAAELSRLGIEITSLAPRFIGDFEKGIDYVGDLEAFEEAFEEHAIIAEALGGYKLSIHSGSDKFSIYPVLGRHAGDHVHLKTAGTSYLEALRIPARHDPPFFREIVDFAFDRFEEDRATYHVTTDLSVVPSPGDVADSELEDAYLDEDNGRQLLHITYGSVLSAQTNGEPRFRDRFFDLLDRHEEEHFEVLQEHFRRHIEGVGEMSPRSDVDLPTTAGAE
jgi:hypothetical protein